MMMATNIFNNTLLEPLQTVFNHRQLSIRHPSHHMQKRFTVVVRPFLDTIILPFSVTLVHGVPLF